MPDVVFAGVSPIAPADAYASASGNVKCTWNLLTPTPPYIVSDYKQHERWIAAQSHKFLFLHL
ncbi:hypothetical protein [Massilia mucilaginosa]|nr:hypothetical protein [Massilia mucilaginosa]